MGGNNAPIMVNGGNVYDSPLGYDAPINYDTGQVNLSSLGVEWSLKKARQEVIRRLSFVVEPVKVQRTFDQLRQTVSTALGFTYVGTPAPRTMASLRLDLLRRLGFSAQATADAWAPGVKELLTNFLSEAQVALQHQYRLSVSTPLASFHDDADVTTLDPWAVFLLALANSKAHHGQQDYDQLGGYITTVAKSADVDQIINTAQDSLLQRYAMDRYTDGKAPLVEGNDKTLIDGVAVEMQAIADAKAKYGQKDAEDYYSRLQEMAQRRPFDLDAMVDSFIRDAQDQLYQQYKELRTERWWTIQCVPGANLYDVPLDLDQYLDFRRITWAGMGDDIEAAVQAQGGKAPEALARANAYFKSTQEQLKQLERVVNKAGGPEKVYNAVMAGAGEGGTTLKRVMEALPDDGKKSLTAAVLNRMGRPTPGQAGLPAEQFSPGTFMTNWSKLSDEARRELFGHYGPGFAKDMDQIARVADNIKSGSQVFANPSGSANRAAAYTYGAALVASLMDVSGVSTASLLGSGAGANVVARAMANPRFVKWLARATTAPVGSVAGSLASLRNIAANTNDPELKQIAEQLGNAEEEDGQAAE